MSNTLSSGTTSRRKTPALARNLQPTRPIGKIDSSIRQALVESEHLDHILQRTALAAPLVDKFLRSTNNTLGSSHTMAMYIACYLERAFCRTTLQKKYWSPVVEMGLFVSGE